MEVLDRSIILKPGDILGPYRVVRMLGQGGFGVTYLAIDTSLDREVAIKEYMPELIASRDSNSSVRPKSINDQEAFTWGLSRFLEEARTLAKFRHPNIVQVMAVFEENETAYMVMDYERGRDLKQVFEEPGNNSEAFLKQIIEPIIDGLAEVHRHGYIHRDIKPANIQIREDNSPVLLDFGSARQAVSSRTQALTALVSVGYAPLEQYNDSSDNQQGPWTDIYALGAVLYFAIVGKPPMDSTLRGSAVLNERPDPLKSVSQMAKDQYSPSFCEAIDWALKFRIADRPQSIEEWRSGLNADNRTVLMPASGVTGHRGQSHAASTKFRNTRQTSSPDPTIIQESSVQPHRPQPAHSIPEHSARSNSRQPQGTRTNPVAEPLILEDWDASGDFGGVTDQVPRGTVRVETKQSNRKTKNGWLFLSAVCVSAVVIGTWQREHWVPDLLGVGEPVSENSVAEQKQSVSAEANLLDGGSDNFSSENQSAIEARRVEELRKQDEARRADEFRQGENARKAEEREKAEIARRAEETRKVREARQLTEAAQLAEVARRAEETIKIREARRLAEVTRRAEATRKAREARQLAARRAEEASKLQEARQRAEDAQREIAPKIYRRISNADMQRVLTQFNALKTAIGQKDAIVVKQLTEPSERMSEYFSYVFSSFSSVVVKLEDINVQPSNQTIQAVLSVKKLIRSNGDIAIPPPEFRKIQLRSVRDQDWSKILW